MTLRVLLLLRRPRSISTRKSQRRPNIHVHCHSLVSRLHFLHDPLHQTHLKSLPLNTTFTLVYLGLAASALFSVHFHPIVNIRPYHHNNVCCSQGSQIKYSVCPCLVRCHLEHPTNDTKKDRQFRYNNNNNKNNRISVLPF